MRAQQRNADLNSAHLVAERVGGNAWKTDMNLMDGRIVAIEVDSGDSSDLLTYAII